MFTRRFFLHSFLLFKVVINLYLKAFGNFFGVYLNYSFVETETCSISMPCSLFIFHGCHEAWVNLSVCMCHCVSCFPREYLTLWRRSTVFITKNLTKKHNQVLNFRNVEILATQLSFWWRCRKKWTIFSIPCVMTVQNIFWTAG